MKLKLTLKPVKKLLAGQLIFCILGALFFFFYQGKNEGLSALLGGLAALIPAIFFANRFFSYQGAKEIKEIVKGFYSGEVGKIFLSCLLFTLIFLLYKVAAIAFFLSYFFVLLAHWLSPWLIDGRL